MKLFLSRKWGCLMLLPLAASLYAQKDLKTRATQVGIDERGYYQSIQVNGEQILGGKQFPVISAGSQGKVILPASMKASGNLLKFTMTDGSRVTLRVKESDACIRLEAVEVPGKYDALVFGPVGVGIGEVVGEVVGVVQEKDMAFGMQALNIKTTAGLPEGYENAYRTEFGYEGTPASLSVSTVPGDRQAVTKTGDGAVFQLGARRRDREEFRPVHGVKESWTLPVKGPDGPVKGAAVALFGDERERILDRIGDVEVEEGLPHPMLKGEWAKKSREAMKSYLITDFTAENFEDMLARAEQAGFDYLYHDGPFLGWGHFNWRPEVSPEGDEGMRKMAEKAQARGIGLGVHTLSNFTTTNDAYVTPVPSEHLLKQGKLVLAEPLDAVQTDIRIRKSELFAVPLTLNGLQIGKELISFGKVEEQGEYMLLKNCRRGAWGTTAAAHGQDEPLYKLWDYPYRTFFPDLELQDAYADRIAELLNKTGVCQISFDGLEGCGYTGHDDYAMSRFVNRIFTQVKHPLRNDASRLSHNLWHTHTYTNWGEPWGEAMRTGQVESRIVNQAFYKRNLFPRMLGWFLIRLADRKQQCTSLEDVEWAMSEAAGFDAGYAMTIRAKTFRRHGQIDRLLEAIRNWDYLREKQAFTEEQRARLRDPQTEWHLEKQNDRLFKLYPLHISKYYTCNLGEMQPGQPGGSDWSWTTPYPGRFAVRLKVEGDGAIENPQFTTPEGVIKFPCTVKEHQYLLYTFDGKAVVTDKNYNVVQTVVPEGEALMPAGTSAVSFSCSLISEDAPDVVIRFMTLGEPETVEVR